MARNFSEPTLLADLEYLPQDTFLAPLLRMRRLRFCRRRVYHQNAGNLDLAVRALLRPSDEILDYLFTHVFSKVPLIGSTLCGLLVQVALGSTSYQLLLKKATCLVMLWLLAATCFVHAGAMHLSCFVFCETLCNLPVAVHLFCHSQPLRASLELLMFDFCHLPVGFGDDFQNDSQKGL